MYVAIPLYPGYIALDAVGPYTMLAFVPGWTVTFVATEPGPVPDDRGNLSIVATAGPSPHRRSLEPVIAARRGDNAAITLAAGRA